MFALAQQQRRTVRTTHTTTVSSGGSGGTRIITVNHCYADLFILKWFEIICAIIVLSVVVPFQCRERAYYTYILAAAVIALIATFMTLLLYFIQCHRSVLHTLSWRTIEVVLNVLLLCLYLAALGIAIYVCIVMNDPYSRRKYDIGIYEPNLFYCNTVYVDANARMIAIAVFCGIASVLHLLSAVLARTSFLL